MANPQTSLTPTSISFHLSLAFSSSFHFPFPTLVTCFPLSRCLFFSIFCAPFISLPLLSSLLFLLLLPATLYFRILFFFHLLQTSIAPRGLCKRVPLPPETTKPPPRVLPTLWFGHGFLITTGGRSTGGTSDHRNSTPCHTPVRSPLHIPVPSPYIL